MISKNHRLSDYLTWASAIVMIVALYLVFVYAPTERTMGDMQRIFYFHVSSAWVGFFAFFVTLIASIVYLWKGTRKWDIVALSSVEVGVTFMTMAIISGSIWARVAWNVWWTWDPRLTTSTILWLIYVSYLMLRNAIDDEARRARFAAVHGIVGFVSVPITFMAIRWWRTIHPVVLDSGGFNLATPMLITMLFCIGTFTLLYFTLLVHRVRLEQLADEVEQLKHELGR
ncbi:MAG: cytochrome c biogenesis protein CcsA [Anaerolineales bacterium]|nr:cytochrome c biogenesis protein CcsA [Anaerolineales bacterium]